jgi:glycosyltransferase involved in cell wall biosynthesis
VKSILGLIGSATAGSTAGATLGASLGADLAVNSRAGLAANLGHAVQRPLRILDVIRSLDPSSGGPAEGLRQFGTALRALGHQQEVLTLDAPDAAWLSDPPAPIHALGPARGLYGQCTTLRPWLQKHAHEFDAVVLHGLWQYTSYGSWQALRGSGVPYFVYPHGMLDPWFKRQYPIKHLKKWLYWPWAEYRVLRDAAAVLFTAEEEARLARQSFWLYRAKEQVLGYGLSLDDAAQRSTPHALLQAHPVLRGKRLLLFLGRLHEKKGCDLLIAAFAKVADQVPALHLVMAGPDQTGLRASLEQQAARLGVAQRITWTGMLQGEMKWSALRAAEVFVLPSHQENFGIAVAEALAMGVPTLISKRVNIWREIVTAGAGLAEDDNFAGTVALLQGWLQRSAAAQQDMRQQTQSCFQRHFHIEGAARRFVSLVAENKRPAQTPGLRVADSQR